MRTHCEGGHLVEVLTTGALVVGRDHLRHHLLAELDTLLDELKRTQVNAA